MVILHCHVTFLGGTYVIIEDVILTKDKSQD